MIGAVQLYVNKLIHYHHDMPWHIRVVWSYEQKHTDLKSLLYLNVCGATVVQSRQTVFSASMYPQWLLCY